MSAPPVEVRFFGAFDMQVHGKAVGAFRSRRVAIVLFILLNAGGAEVSRSYIAGQVWPESTEAQALANLRQSLVDLRKSLGPEAHRLIAVDRRSLRFNIESVVVDSLRFQQLERSQTENQLREAVSFYRGALLLGLSEEYAQLARDDFEARYLRLLERLLDCALAARDWQEIASLSLKILQIDPTHERAACELIRERAERGDTAGAIRAYQEVRASLRRLLGLPPSPTTTQTYETALESLSSQRARTIYVVSEESKRRIQQSELEVVWSSCTELEQEVLRRLSMFSGPFSVAEVNAICPGFGFSHSQWVVILGQLVERDLVRFTASSQDLGYSLRQEVAELGRKLRAERSDEPELLHDFLECMASIAEQGYAAFSGTGQRLWLERFAAHQETLRTAFRLAVDYEPSPDFAYRLASSISGYFMLVEGSLSMWEEIKRTASRTGGSEYLRATALNAAGFRAQTLAQLEESSNYLGQAYKIAENLDSTYLKALVQTNQAMVHVGRGELSKAQRLYKLCLKLFQELGNVWWQALIELNLAEIEWRWGKADDLEPDLLKALKVFQELEDDLEISSVRITLSSIYLQRGQVEEARNHQSIAHSRLQRLPARYKQVYSLIQLGEIELIAQDYATAEAYVFEARRLAEECNLPHAVVSATRIRVQCAIWRDQLDRAERLILDFLPKVQALKLPFQTAVFIELLALIRIRQDDPVTAKSLLARGWIIRKASEPDLAPYPKSILRVLHELRQRGHSPEFLDSEPFNLDLLMPVEGEEVLGAE